MRLKYQGEVRDARRVLVVMGGIRQFHCKKREKRVIRAKGRRRYEKLSVGLRVIGGKDLPS